MNDWLVPLSSSCLIGGMLLLATAILPREGRALRWLILAVGLLTGVTYLAWRACATVPRFHWTLPALLAWGFLLIEIPKQLNEFISYLFLTRRSDRSAEADEHDARLRRCKAVPKVDVFIPTYNENQTILEKTIIGVTGLDYPNLRVWVLDDGKRDWLAAFCRKRGIRYLRRHKNQHAKAGNLNAALAASRDGAGDFVAVFDADFVPRHDFLYRTLGFFDDPKVGIVQTPQHFYNPDPIQHNLLAGKCITDEQRNFFDIVQPAKDAWDLAFCCGTSAVIRRSCLNRIGGVPTETVTEDALLTHYLMDEGYITRYLDEPLSLGLSPEGMREYLTQRNRWCTGTLQQLYSSKAGPFGRNRLTFLQRLSLLNSIGAWLCKYPFVIVTLLAPNLYWFFGLTLIKTSIGECAFFLLPNLVVAYFIQRVVCRSRVLPLLAEVQGIIGCFTLNPAIVRVLLRPRGHPFKVTAKGGDRSRKYVQWSLLWKIAAVWLVTFTGVVIGSLRFSHVDSDLTAAAVNYLWSWYNLIVLSIAALVAIEQPRRRTEERFESGEEAVIQFGQEEVRCLVSDLSVGGASLDCTSRFPTGTKLGLVLANAGQIMARVVRSTSRQAAIEFVHSDLTRDAIIRKLFASGHRNQPDQCSSMRSGLSIARAMFLR